jgi:hypothetical protein
MNKKITLLIDALINLILGVLLLSFNPSLCGFLGVPYSELHFYPNILGAVFIGITIALVIEAYKKPESSHTGLGLTGAVCINISGGTVLLLWLIFGNLIIPLQGLVLLWALASALFIISITELFLGRGT